MAKRPSGEPDRQHPERDRERDREACVEQLVPARIAGRDDRDRHRRRGQEADRDGPHRPAVPGGAGRLGDAHYCFWYGRPSAAGGIERPITPATAISVRTYGSAWNSTAAESEYSGRRCASALEKPNSRQRRSGAERLPVAEDDRGQRDEAAARGHVLVERVDEPDREERAAGGREHARGDHRAVADAVDVDPHRVGRARMLADRADPEPERGLEQNDLGERDQDQREPDHQAEVRRMMSPMNGDAVEEATRIGRRDAREGGPVSLAAP